MSINNIRSQISLDTSLNMSASTLGVNGAFIDARFTISLVAGNIYGLYSTPFRILENTNPSSYITVDKMILVFIAPTVSFANGGDVQLQYGNTANGLGPIASETVSAAAVNSIGGSNPALLLFQGTQANPLLSTSIGGQSIYLSNKTAPFSAGTAAVLAYIWYKQFTLS